MTLTVVVDRDSVAMGDDALPHADTWKFPDDARLGDVVAAMVQRRYLPMLDSDVTWQIDVDPDADLHRDTSGAVEWTSHGPHPVRVGQLMCSVSSAPGWVQLNSITTGRTHLSQTGLQHGSGIYVVAAQYFSAGRVRPWPEFTTWIAETDEHERLRHARELHEQWPEIFDEFGERYPKNR